MHINLGAIYKQRIVGYRNFKLYAATTISVTQSKHSSLVMNAGFIGSSFQIHSFCDIKWYCRVLVSLLTLLDSIMFIINRDINAVCMKFILFSLSTKTTVAKNIF